MYVNWNSGNVGFGDPDVNSTGKRSRIFLEHVELETFVKILEATAEIRFCVWIW